VNSREDIICLVMSWAGTNSSAWHIFNAESLSIGVLSVLQRPFPSPSIPNFLTSFTYSSLNKAKYLFSRRSLTISQLLKLCCHATNQMSSPYYSWQIFLKGCKTIPDSLALIDGLHENSQCDPWKTCSFGPF